ncbi:hypothetical protein L1049_024618 [Liquidambar formosana]|uniref:Embryo defective 1381 n=1 Tax=Liquidambar formosana TaxID=63359 RepID=A0AAP0S2A4_LIQFO
MEDNTQTIARNSTQQPRPAPPRPSISHSPRPQRRRQNYPHPRTSHQGLEQRATHHRLRRLSAVHRRPPPNQQRLVPMVIMVQLPPTYSPNPQNPARALPRIHGRKGCPTRHHKFPTNILHPPKMARPQHCPAAAYSKTTATARKLQFPIRLRQIDGVLGLGEKGKNVSVEEASYYREAVVALRLAKEVIKVQQGWRANAVAHLNRTGGFSRSLANSATDWPSLLLELLSEAAEIDYFQQPKLVINNIDVLRNAILEDDSTVCASMYHDSLLWRIIALGANERCLPVILITSNSYYSYRAYMDFGFPDIFISRETFGWSPQEAKMHMVTDYFSHSEWTVISEVLGPNPRHLFELYALKQSNYYQKVMDDRGSTFEDIIDAYLAFLQATVVNPAMEKALTLLQKFAVDARSGRISEDKLRFGAPWRHPPRTDNPTLCLEWAKLQLIDFVQSLDNAEFGVNYLADCSLEIFDDPAALALLEVGLLYSQRDPSFIRPISRGIQRCIVRWLVQERMQMNFRNSLQYLWQRIFRGRSYRHLMLQAGYK